MMFCAAFVTPSPVDGEAIFWLEPEGGTTSRSAAKVCRIASVVCHEHGNRFDLILPG